jgi:hypothetical protein
MRFSEAKPKVIFLLMQGFLDKYFLFKNNLFIFKSKCFYVVVDKR